VPTPEERGLIEKQVLPPPTKVQVAITLVQDDSVRFVGAERTGQGLRWLGNRSAVFEIGPITKVLTATLLAQQVKQGSQRLDEIARRSSPRSSWAGRARSAMSCRGAGACLR